MYVGVCVRVCVRDRVSVCVNELESEGVYACVCVCVCERERET